MRNKLLVSTAVLLVSLGYASAQNVPGSSERGGQRNEAPAAHSNQERGSSQERGGNRAVDSQGPQRERGQAQGQRQREQTTGQNERGERQSPQLQRSQRQNDQTTGQGSGPSQRSNRPQDQTTGQAQPPREPNAGRTGQNQRPLGQSNQMERQAPQNQQGQAPQNGPNQNQGTAQSQGQQGQDHSGQVTLNAQQRTQLRQTVLARGDVPRVNDVNFSVRIGVAVPDRIRLVAVTPELLTIRPDWRDHYYFVVRDEIVIVDRGHRVVAILPVGDQVGSNDGPAVVQGGGVYSDLSAEEIRIIQQALVANGYQIDVDGVFGPETQQALIAFQRRNGFAASGRIDSQTLVALNVNIRGSGQAGGTIGGSNNSGPNNSSTMQQQPNTGPGGNPQQSGTSTNMQPGSAGAGNPPTSTSGQGSNNPSGSNSGARPDGSSGPNRGANNGLNANPSVGTGPSGPGGGQK